MNGVLRVVAGLFGIVGWVVFLGLQKAWRATFGWVFNTLADLLDKVSVNTVVFGRKHLFGTVSSWLRSLDHNVWVLLGHLALESENLAVWLFSRLTYVYHLLGREVHGLAVDLLSFAARLYHVYLPRLLRALWHRLEHGLARTWRYIRRAIPSLERLLKRSIRYLWKGLKQDFRFLLKTWHSLTRLLKQLKKDLGWAAKRLLALERRFVPKSLRKWLAAIFPIFGIAWLLANSWVRLGKEIARWTYNMVGDFIAYFERLGKHVSMKEVYTEADKLTLMLVEEYRFLMDLEHAPREAPGPLISPKPPV